MNKIDNLSLLLDKAGIRHKIWQNKRIYFSKDRTANCYIEFEDPAADATSNALESASLRVFSNCASQTAKWNVNRAKQIKHAIMLELYEAKIMLEKPCDRFEQVIL